MNNQETHRGSNRKPWLQSSLDDIGGAFCSGTILGSAWHLSRGIYTSPRGQRLIGGLQEVRISGPRLGGSFALWMTLLRAFERPTAYVRQKEDLWNKIISAAAAGGVHQMGKGLGRASRVALISGGCYAMLRGSFIFLDRKVEQMEREFRYQLRELVDPNSSIAAP